MNKARILTADEIRRLPRANIVWIEFFNTEEDEATSLVPAMKCADGSLVDEETCVFNDYEQDIKYQGDGYWRFWSDEPTEEQRKATRWAHETLTCRKVGEYPEEGGALYADNEIIARFGA